MAKYTPKQIERSLKKLARSCADANIPRPGEEYDGRENVSRLFVIMDQAFKLLRKTGTHRYYDERVKEINRELGK